MTSPGKAAKFTSERERLLEPLVVVQDFVNAFRPQRKLLRICWNNTLWGPEENHFVVLPFRAGAHNYPTVAAVGYLQANNLLVERNNLLKIVRKDSVVTESRDCRHHPAPKYLLVEIISRWRPNVNGNTPQPAPMHAPSSTGTGENGISTPSW